MNGIWENSRITRKTEKPLSPLFGNEMKQKLLLTGATGTVGKEVLNQLLEKNSYEITVICRKSSSNAPSLKRHKGKINIFFADFSKKDPLVHLATCFDIVVHLAAIIPPLAEKKPITANSVNFLGTRSLVKIIEETSPNAFFMFSSSISVYGDRVKTPNINTSDSLSISSGDKYARTKIDAEQIIVSSRLKWTIFRLTAIMGVKNHKMSGLMFHMPLETHIEIATPSDTARAFVNGIETPSKLTNRIFNLGGGENCRTTYRDFLSKNFELNGLGKLNFPTNSFADKNFHCGLYQDGNELEAIINFRSETLEDYYASVEASVTVIQKISATIFQKPIKYFLSKKSEPLRAYKTQNQELMGRFFK